MALPMSPTDVNSSTPSGADKGSRRSLMLAKRMAFSTAISAVSAVVALTVLSVTAGESSFLVVVAVLVVLVSVPTSLLAAAITEIAQKVNAGLPEPVAPALATAAASALAIPLAQHLSLTPSVIVGAAVALIAGCSSWWTTNHRYNNGRHTNSS